MYHPTRKVLTSKAALLTFLASLALFPAMTATAAPADPTPPSAAPTDPPGAAATEDRGEPTVGRTAPVRGNVRGKSPHPAMPEAPGPGRAGGPADPADFDSQVLAPASPPEASASSESAAAVDAAQVAAAAVVNTSFTGMNQLPSNAFGTGYPPDTSLASGGSTVLQAVNRRMRMTTTAGGSAQTVTLDTFFKGVNGNQLFDPKVFYDRNAANPRYWTIAIEGRDNTFSRLWLSVSRSSNPTSLAQSQWCRYVFDARVPVAGKAPTWADYPSIGTGPNGLLITTNQFNNANNFQYNAIWAFNKLNLANNSAGCPSTNWYNWSASPTLGDLSAFTVQPVQHYTNPSSFTGIASPNYLVNSYAGTGSLYRVWRIYNLASGSPRLQVANLYGSYTYSGPPLSPGGRNPTTGAATGIDSGDTRTLQAAGLGNRLYATHGTACQYTAGTSVDACARYVAIDVGATTSGAIAAAIRQQTVLGGGDGWYYHHPAVAVNNAGAVGASFNINSLSGASSAGYATKFYTQAGFPASYYLAQGNCYANATYQPDRGINRSGDYNGAQTSPDGVSFWLAAERSVSITGVGCGWQTRVARISP